MLSLRTKHYASKQFLFTFRGYIDDGKERIYLEPASEVWKVVPKLAARKFS